MKLFACGGKRSRPEQQKMATGKRYSNRPVQNAVVNDDWRRHEWNSLSSSDFVTNPGIEKAKE